MNNCEKCGYYLYGECNICGRGISGEDTFCLLCKNNPNCYYKELSKLKADNERLKEENFNFEEIVKLCRCEQYEQTLQEIKEIAKRGFAVCDDDCGNAIRYTQILDIINKAEEE